ncbi:hypothetical protein ONZ45_g1529 [Pleurotus djamor]|nr:hypothetical protein ONZ45_g1529 [Pleurotus djamor]
MTQPYYEYYQARTDSPTRHHHSGHEKDHSQSSPDYLRLLPGARKVGLTLVLPAILVGLFAIAIPVAVIIYIWRNALRMEGWHAVVVLESRPWALSISQLGSHLILITIAPLMGVVAVTAASSWLAAQTHANSQASLPTPAQYTLLLQMCMSANLPSLWFATNYAFTSSSKRASLPSIFSKVFSSLLIAFIFSHGIGVFDFLLHTGTTAEPFLIDFSSPVSPLSLGREVNLTTCPGPQEAMPNAPCQATFSAQGLPSWGSREVLLEGGSTASNISQSNFVISLPSTPEKGTGDVSEVGVVVTPSVDLSIAFTAQTIGMGASCQAIEASKCNISGPGLAQQGVGFNCSEAGFPYIWQPVSAVEDDSPKLTVNGSGNFLQIPSTPFTLWAKLVYADQLSRKMESDGYTFLNSYAKGFRAVLINCEVTSYEVTISYRNGTYSLVSATPGSFNLTSALSGALMFGLDIPGRMNSFAQTFLTGMTSPEFAGIVARELSKSSLAWSAGLLQTRLTDEQSQSIPRPATRYPLVYLTVLVGLCREGWKDLENSHARVSG